MNELALFLYGLLAFSLAVGPLLIAAFLDSRDKKK